MHKEAVPADPVERVQRIAHIVEEHSAANERLGRLAPQVVDKLHEQRLLRLLLPRVYGGDEIDLPTWFRTMEAMAKHDGSTAWCVGQINGCAMASAALEPAVARKIWGEPRAVLSWGPPIRSRADEVDGGHRVSGEWSFSSGSRHASWVGLMATVHGRDGKPIPLGEGLSTRIFLVPVGAVTFIENWNVIGLTATNSGGFKAENLFVPDGFSLNREHLRDVRLTTTLYKFANNNLFATGFSAVALGLARSMLDAIVGVVKGGKTPRLGKTSLIENHHVQFQIGEAEARLRSARTYVETTVERVWREVATTDTLTTANRMDIRMATTFAIHEAVAVADTAWQVGGANVIFQSGPFERRLRDIRTVMQQVQGRKSHLQDVGAYLLGFPPNFAFT
jgi:alkylation response protein AidB-like acyl-CoA dehydrogenase